MSQSTRIEYIDFLKTIGLIGIILAHVNPPAIIMMVRNFDVPLMIIVSAILAENSYKKRISKGVSTKSYFLLRFKRLVFPTWIFLTFYFAIYAVLSGEYENVEYYFYSYALTRYGIGYVWIILIYLYCAFLVPLFNRIPFNTRNNVIVLICYISYEIFFYYNIGTQNKFVMSTFYYVIPYGTLTYIGFHFSSMKVSTQKRLSLFSGVIFIILLLYYWKMKGVPQMVSIVKYPPRLYYLSFGIFCSSVLLLLCKYTTHFINYGHSFFRYISSHSMWIYLWHILVLTVYDFLRFPSTWIIKFPVVFMSSLLVVFLINKALDMVERKHRIQFIKYLRG